MLPSRAVRSFDGAVFGRLVPEDVDDDGNGGGGGAAAATTGHRCFFSAALLLCSSDEPLKYNS